MRRREVIAGLTGAAAWPLAARAQQPANIPRIGFLGNSSASLEANPRGLARPGLRRGTEYRHRISMGRRELRAFSIPDRGAARPKRGGHCDRRDPRLARCQKATNSVPLVMVGVGDPVATGLVASLARPGGNVTGLTSTAEETEGKRCELLKELKPELSHVAVLWNPDNPTLLSQLKEMRTAAQVLGISLLVLSVRNTKEIEESFKAMVGDPPGALIVMGDRLFLHNRQSIIDFATKQGLPVVPVHPELVEAGGLMSYGPSYPGMHRRAAYFVDRILKGTKPADLPVERPTKFLLVLNLKSAKALGLTIPPTLLARADEVIE